MRKQTVVVSFVILCYSLCVFADDVSIKETKFSKNLDPTPAEKQSKMQARSNIECASVCSMDDSCLSYRFVNGTCWRTSIGGNAYTKSTGHIMTTTTTTTTTTTSTTTTGYPGYLPYTLDGHIHLLKFTPPSSISADTARGVCEDEGTHLITILSAPMLADLDAIIMKWGSPSVWIDGYDRDADDVLRTWAGNTLPWTRWGGSDPTGGADDCMGMYYAGPYSEYRMYDAVCNTTPVPRLLVCEVCICITRQRRIMSIGCG